MERLALLKSLLKKVPYFQDVVDDDLEELVPHARLLEFQDGEALFRIGEPALGLYFLVEGRVKAVRYSSDGRVMVLREFRTGETFNEVGAFETSLNPSSGIAVGKGVKVLLIPSEPLLQFMRKHPEVDHKIIKEMARKLRFAMGKVKQLGLMDVKSRLALHLLEHADENGVIQGTSQESLAAHLGTVRQVVGRILGDLQRKGAVRVDRGRITIVSRQKLVTLTDIDTDLV